MAERQLSHAVGKCAYCKCLVYPAGSSEALANPWCQRSKDHVRPASHGHGRGPNLVIACRGCNDIKGEYPARLFEYFLRHTKDTTVPKKRLSFRLFCYELAEFGFIAAVARINWIKDNRPSPAPPRDVRGRFTASDLRLSRRRKSAALNGAQQ